MTRANKHDSSEQSASMGSDMLASSTTRTGRKPKGHVSPTKLSNMTTTNTASTNHVPMSSSGLTSTSTSKFKSAAQAATFVASQTPVGQPFLHEVVVFDEAGQDVTPRPLFADKHRRKAGGGVGGMASGSVEGGSTSDHPKSNSTFEKSTEMGFEEASAAAKKSFAFQATGASQQPSDMFSELEEETGSVASEEDHLDDGFRKRRHPNSTDPSAAYTFGSGGVGGWTEEALSAPVHLTLQESDMMALLDVPASLFLPDAPDVAAMKAANVRYQQILASRGRNENCVHRAMQTFNFPVKNKDSQATGAQRVHAETQANDWRIWDAVVGGDRPAGDPHNDADVGRQGDPMDMDALPGLDANASALHGSRSRSVLGQVDPETTTSSLMEEGGLSSAQDTFASQYSDAAMNTGVGGTVSGFRSATGQGATTGTNTSAAQGHGGRGAVVSLTVLNQARLRNSLRVMESAIVENNYLNRLFSYRDLPMAGKDGDAESGSGGGKEAEGRATAGARRPSTRRSTVSGRTGQVQDGDEGDEEEEDDDEEDDESSEEEEGGEDATPRRAKDGAPSANKKTSNGVDALSTKLPSVQLLWSYRCDLARGRPVMGMSWNKENQNILAIAYGEIDSSQSGASDTCYKGLVLCWTLKNVEYPERIYRTKTSVTSVDFSNTNPNLLAAGLSDGRIAIFDVRSQEDRVVLDNTETGGKHRGAVWEVRWVERERIIGDEQSKGETLVSVSTDGRVVQWLLRKGLEFTDLMSLKRVTRQNDSESSKSTDKSSSLISRQSGGLCLDFNRKDSNVYLIGTEDGHLHRCSCSYNEQYLDTYFGHSGPVYRVKWSPFRSNVFLTCSSDWTVRLWNQEQEECVFKFQSGRDAISDICWSPTSSTVFGCVSSDGRIEVWDLQYSVLDPCITHSVLDHRLTSIIFSPNAPCLVTGDDYGSVNVYKLHKIVSEQQAEAALRTLNGDTSVGVANTSAGNWFKYLPQQFIDDQGSILHQIMVSKNQLENQAAKPTDHATNA